MDFRTAHTDCIMEWEDAQLAIIRRHYPEWEIWLVREFPCLTTWHARPEGELGKPLAAECPEYLVRMIASCSLPYPVAE